MPKITITTALDVSNRSVSFREAEVLLQNVLGVDRTYIHTHPEAKLSPEQTLEYEQYLARREKNEPVAYIIGHKEFYGRRFKTDHRALIPRPETEGLVDLGLKWLCDSKRTRVLELGTGCGNIAVTLAVELSGLDIIATDIDTAALALAQENAEGVDKSYQLRFIQADLFAHPVIEQKKPFDLIIANLPYVSDSWKQDPQAQPEVVFQEPDIALFGGSDGLDIYRRFFDDVAGYIAPDGIIIVEFSEEHGEAMAKLATEKLHAEINIHQDYAGLDRVLEVKLP